MRIETFQAIQREIARDPLTERQAAELAGQDRNRLLSSKEAAEMLGVAPETLRNKARRHEIKSKDQRAAVPFPPCGRTRLPRQEDRLGAAP